MKLTVSISAITPFKLIFSHNFTLVFSMSILSQLANMVLANLAFSGPSNALHLLLAIAVLSCCLKVSQC